MKSHPRAVTLLTWTGLYLAAGTTCAEPGEGDSVRAAEEAGAKEEAPESSGHLAGHLAGFETLDAARRKVILVSLETLRDHSDLRYLYGSADPANGGFDCSGAVHYILRQVGIDAPRSSAAQYEWVKRGGHFTAVDDISDHLSSPAFSQLLPGDLLFWGERVGKEGSRKLRITHVQMYLGKEKNDGRAVMIGASDGRSYRGKRQSGYGIVDFRLPSTASSVRFVGFGPPPGLIP